MSDSQMTSAHMLVKLPTNLCITRINLQLTERHKHIIREISRNSLPKAKHYSSTTLVTRGSYVHSVSKLLKVKHHHQLLIICHGIFHCPSYRPRLQRKAAVYLHIPPHSHSKSEAEKRDLYLKKSYSEHLHPAQDKRIKAKTALENLQTCAGSKYTNGLHSLLAPRHMTLRNAAHSRVAIHVATSLCFLLHLQQKLSCLQSPHT